METVNLIANFWAFNLFMIITFTLTSSYQYKSEPMPALIAGNPPPAHTYTRFSEVEKFCNEIISSASKLDLDTNRFMSFRSELSFIKGDWGQDPGDAPLMPFDGHDAANSSGQPHPLQLSSFSLVHVDMVPRLKFAINVSGVLGLGMSRNGTAPEFGQYSFPEFQIWPGSSELRVPFEGVYVESERNGGERVLCLLGNAMLPPRQQDSKDPWEWAKDSSSRPPLLRDDRILLILRYPKTFALASRAVRGEMSSLNEESSNKFFDKVHLSSRVGAYTKYEFGSDKILSKACSPYPYRDNVVVGGNQSEIYKGMGICEILDQLVTGEVLNVVPNWNCNSTDEYCSKLGPFASEQEIRATDGGFANVGLIMQDVRCEPRNGQNNVSSARVSAVFRAIPPWERWSLAAERTGLSGMTLSAEGIWVSTAGQLCMVGCLGQGDARCHSRICLYISKSFSIKRRYVVFGQISSISSTAKGSHYPLSFERSIQPLQLWNRYGGRPFVSTYQYSKIKLAGAFLERSEPFDFGSTIKKSLLSYPKEGQDSDEYVNLSNLSDDLTLHVPAVPDPLPEVGTHKSLLQLELLSLGALFGRYWAYNNGLASPVSAPSSSKDTSTERQLLLNVSAELRLSGEPYKNASVLYVEGLYNPIDGKMYLIGCRDVRASWKILSESMDLEDGLDCLIEVKVEYPPTMARWLVNPTAKVSITSQRTQDDPLHFRQIKLQTLPILYREQRDDMLSRRGVEATLRILTLSLAIACILSQLFYVGESISSIPFISLVMLGVEALGYSIPLITGAEALFARMSSESYEGPSYELEKNQWYKGLDYLVKILVLGAFLLTLRLGQKVLKSRIRLLTRSPLEPGRVPSDKRVLLISSAIHFVGFLVVLGVHSVNASERPIQPAAYIDPRGNSHKLQEWGMQLKEYVGLVQDFFLLPQIIGNILWQIDCKPLRKAYYIGITVVRLLPHVYNYIRAPVFNPYFSMEYEFVNPSLDFYSKFGDVAIPVTATVLAAIIYVQQKWSYQKLSQNVRIGQKKILPLGSRVYERLPSISFEAELVSGVNEASTQLGAQQNDEE